MTLSEFNEVHPAFNFFLVLVVILILAGIVLGSSGGDGGDPDGDA